MIAEGDHVCIAADDPIHAIPLHYLHLESQPAVNFLSFSRVASLADARLTFESPLQRPTTALAAFLPALSERDIALKTQVFLRLCETLKLAGIEVTRLEGPAVNRRALLDAMAQYDLVHIQTHGRFRDELDPMDSAGILLSERGEIPLRGMENLPLLTPRDVLNSHSSLAGGLVALSACVSGLGRRGMAGDTLGLEFALRFRGASSVIASHWDVIWPSASSFFISF